MQNGSIITEISKRLQWGESPDFIAQAYNLPEDWVKVFKIK
jgi:hypothetical protein